MIRSLSCRPFPPRRGAAATVEFAVASLVFFTLFMALVDFGRGLMVSYGLVNAARRAARVALPPGRSTATIKQAALDALSRAGIPARTVTPKVLVNDQEVEASTARSGDRIKVTITVPVTEVTWLPGTRWIVGSLTGSYTLCRE